MINDQLKFRANQIVQITRILDYDKLPKELRNRIDRCKREGININNLLNAGAPIDEELHLRIQNFLICSKDAMIEIKDKLPSEHCNMKEVLPSVEFQNRLILMIIKGEISESMFS